MSAAELCLHRFGVLNCASEFPRQDVWGFIDVTRDNQIPSRGLCNRCCVDLPKEVLSLYTNWNSQGFFRCEAFFGRYYSRFGLLKRTCSYIVLQSWMDYRIELHHTNKSSPHSIRYSMSLPPFHVQSSPLTKTIFQLSILFGRCGWHCNRCFSQSWDDQGLTRNQSTNPQLSQGIASAVPVLQESGCHPVSPCFTPGLLKNTIVQADSSERGDHFERYQGGLGSPAGTPRTEQV